MIVILMVVILSFVFRVIGALVFRTPLGWILIGLAIYYLMKNRRSRPQPIEYEVLDEGPDSEVPDDVEVFPDDKNSWKAVFLKGVYERNKALFLK